MAQHRLGGSMQCGQATPAEADLVTALQGQQRDARRSAEARWSDGWTGETEGCCQLLLLRQW